MIKCAILSIGSELLEGSVLDTNANFLEKRLSDMGIKPANVCQIPDDKAVIIEVLQKVSEEYDIVFTTGGLGPTFDDLTPECVAISAGVKWERNETAFAHMERILKSVGVTLNENHYRQANLPKGSDLFENFSGTALGFGIAIGKSYVISMPGVPSEMKGMFDKSVAPFIEKKFNLEKPFKIDVYIAAVPESDVDALIIKEKIPSGVECIINAGKGEVVVKIRGLDEKSVKLFAEKVSSAFPQNFIGYNGYTLPFALFSLLKEKNITFATAESCTGGLIAKTLTDIPGSSQVFLGGVVSYANSMKENILGVKSETLRSFGAVSEETALEMARGVVNITGCDYGLSVTGIAGPDGGTEEKPVGTVFIGLVSKEKSIVKGFKFRGDRDDVRNRTLNAALFQAIAFIKDENR